MTSNQVLAALVIAWVAYTIIQFLRCERDYQESLKRHPDWHPVFTVQTLGWLRHRVRWTGPHGGRHVNWGVTPRLAIWMAKDVISSWTRRKKRNVVKKTRVVRG